MESRLVEKPLDYDRRTPLPGNHVFEAHNDCDPTNVRFFCSFYDDASVILSFVEDRGRQHGLHVHDMIHIDPDQCEALAAGLLEAAKAIRGQSQADAA